MSDIRWEGFTHDEVFARVQRGPGQAGSADAPGDNRDDDPDVNPDHSGGYTENV
jgi:hypothetical protein